MGNAAGRTAPVTVDESTSGVLTLLDITIDAQENKINHIGGRYEPFSRELSNCNCIFVGYDGELLSW